MENQIEIWKDISNYKGLYQASSFGRIKSYDKICWNGTGFFEMKGKILKQIKNKEYLMINLYKNKKPKVFTVHQLIAITFLNHKPCKFKLVVDHIDNIKTNNNLNNLQIISNRENSSKDKSSKSGYSCIYRNSNAWLVRIRVNGKKVSVGTFKDINQAIAKRDEFIKSL
jgi:hypothetical protein